MAQRSDSLRELLMKITGIKYCYINPPSSIRMSYPCIIIHLSDQDRKFADNQRYWNWLRWSITIVDPESINGESYIEQLTSLSYCSFDRLYIADNLHHYVFSIYY